MGIFDDKINRIILFLALLFILEVQLVLRGDNTTSIQNGNKTGIVKTPINNEKGPETITLLLGGDVMLGRSVMQEALKNGGYPYLFEKISDFTKDADIFFVNLENPIIEDCPIHTGGFKFCAPSQAVDGLVSAGVDVVTLANNHTKNFGESGYLQTKTILDDKNIKYVGDNTLVIYEFNNLFVGFLGFDFTVNPPTEADFKLISESDDKADFLVVGVHWGNEYQNSANERQRNWTEIMVNRGADIIAGHHPHWIQNFECSVKEEQYKNIENNYDYGYSEINEESPLNNNLPICNGITGKPVYYSLGNLVFDQMWSEKTKKGMLVKLKLGKGGIIDEERFDTYMVKIGQPEITGISTNEHQ